MKTKDWGDLAMILTFICLGMMLGYNMGSRDRQTVTEHQTTKGVEK